MIQLMHCARPTRRYAGYTIAEMLVMVAVLSIISALAVPMFRGQDTTQLREAAKLLAADLDAAKFESMTHADDLRLVVFDTTNHTYHIAAASDPTTPITNPVDGQPYLVDFGEGRASALGIVQIQSVDLDGDDELGFGLYGQLDQATTATITLAANDAELTLTLDPATGESVIGQIQ